MQTRARAIGSVVAVADYVATGVWLAYGIEGYQILGVYPADGPANPLHFNVLKGVNWPGAYKLRPWIAVAPVLVVTGIFLPLIVIYTAWVCKALWGKVTEADVKKNARSLYQGRTISRKGRKMWYFAWRLGLPLAAIFAVVNAMWLEMQEDARKIGVPEDPPH